MKLLNHTLYHTVLVVLYIFVYIYFFFFSPSPFSYFSFDINDFVLFFLLLLSSFISFFIVNYLLNFGSFIFKKKDLFHILLISLYAVLLFAIPEEIIFRGLIQTNLQVFIPNTTIAIILSSIIYGFAHLLNGARSFLPSGWNWKFMIVTFILGLHLGFAYHVTNSLVLPTLLHSLFIIFGFFFIKY